MDEVKAASAVEHPNLLKMIDYGLGVKTNPQGQQKNVLFIVLELCLKESLFDFVTQIPGQPFPEGMAVKFF